MYKAARSTGRDGHVCAGADAFSRIMWTSDTRGYYRTRKPMHREWRKADWLDYCYYQAVYGPPLPTRNCVTASSCHYRRSALMNCNLLRLICMPRDIDCAKCATTKAILRDLWKIISGFSYARRFIVRPSPRFPRCILTAIIYFVITKL